MQFQGNLNVLEYDFEESIGYWIGSANRAYMDALKREMDADGITFRQAQVLAWLSCDGPLSQAELASRMMIEPPSLVGTLDRMESQGLVERQTCPNDRRKNLVHPLPAAEEVWAKFAETGRQIRARATQGMSKQDVTNLKRLLDQVCSNLKVESLESVS